MEEIKPSKETFLKSFLPLQQAYREFMKIGRCSLDSRTQTALLDHVDKIQAFMCCEQNRILSFSFPERWPERKPSPEKMAAAGMYYIGIDDWVSKNFDLK